VEAELDTVDRSRELRPAIVLAVLAFLAFAAFVTGVLTDTFALDDRAVTWVGAGLVGLSSAVFAGWAVVLYMDAEMPSWTGRVGGDLLLAGLGVLLAVAGLPTFAAGVL
jgi:hypothetical protein